MKKLAIVIIALAAPLAQAEDAATAQQEAPPAQVGDETRAWLQLQASGAASVTTPATTSGEVADRVYQRYLKSFEHPIPEQFQRESLSTGGGK